MKRIITFLILLTAFVGSSFGATSPTMSFTNSTVDVFVGGTVSNPLVTTPVGLVVTYSSDNTSVATVDESTGAVTIVGTGTAKITASAAAQTVSGTSYKAKTASYTLNVVTKTLTATGGPSDMLVEKTVTASMSLKNSAGSSVTASSVNYTSANTSIATVSGSTITGVAKGTATINFTAKATGYDDIAGSFTVDVREALVYSSINALIADATNAVKNKYVKLNLTDATVQYIDSKTAYIKDAGTDIQPACAITFTSVPSAVKAGSTISATIDGTFTNTKGLNAIAATTYTAGSASTGTYTPTSTSLTNSKSLYCNYIKVPVTLIQNDTHVCLISINGFGYANSADKYTASTDRIKGYAEGIVIPTDVSGSNNDFMLLKFTAFTDDEKNTLFPTTDASGNYLLNEYVDYTNPTTATSSVNVKLTRYFKPTEWATLVLPFDMKRKQIREAFGAGTLMANIVSSIKNSATAIYFKSVDLTATAADDDKCIYANIPCLIKPATKQADDVYTITGVSIQPAAATNNLTLSVPFGTGTDAANPIASTSDFWIFKGTYQTMVGSQILTEAEAMTGNSKGIYYLSKNMYNGVNSTITPMNGFRGYFCHKGNASAKESSFDFIIDDETTGIVTIQGEHPTAPSNVYSINGQMVRKAATSLENLPKGIYIMNGKKYIVK